MKLGHEKPVNKTAAIVMSKGFEYKSGKKILTIESDTPLKITPIPNKASKSVGFVDLTGVMYGRFVVVGNYAEGKGWAVRCSCGTYCVRSSKAIKNPNNHSDRCEECRHLAFLIRRESQRMTGEFVES